MSIMFILIAVSVFLAVVVIALIAVLHERNGEEFEGLNPEQMKEKEENLARSLSLARSQGEVTNDDIERLLGVSNATAERYLNELESRGHFVQIGKTGKGVRYMIR